MSALVAPRWRRAALIAIVTGVLLCAALAVVVFHGSATGVDAWVYRRFAGLSPEQRAGLADTSSPQIDVGALLVVTVLAAATRRWRLAVLAVLGPLLAFALTDLVLKPLVDRHIDLPGGAMVESYPSGHETGVASCALVLLVAAGQVPVRRWVRAVLGAVLAGWVVVAGAGLVAAHYHYASDVVGALGLCAAVVLTLALTLDRLMPATPSANSPGARNPARTSRAA